MPFSSIEFINNTNFSLQIAVKPWELRMAKTMKNERIYGMEKKPKQLKTELIVETDLFICKMKFFFQANK